MFGVVWGRVPTLRNYLQHYVSRVHGGRRENLFKGGGYLICGWLIIIIVCHDYILPYRSWCGGGLVSRWW